MAYRVTNELEAGAQAKSLAVAAAEAGLEGAAQQTQAAAAAAAGAPSSTPTDKATAAAAAASTTGTGTATVTTAGPGGPAGGGRRLLDEDEERDAVFYRLEMLGYRVGQGLVERFSRERPRFHDTLDVIKFLCKDLWTLVFRKQVDNLKTNHRGVYVLTDNSFRPFQRMSTEAGGQAVVRAQPVSTLRSIKLISTFTNACSSSGSRAELCVARWRRWALRRRCRRKATSCPERFSRSRRSRPRHSGRSEERGRDTVHMYCMCVSTWSSLCLSLKRLICTFNDTSRQHSGIRKF